MRKPSEDEFFLLHAHARAMNGLGHTRPNPPVGAVIVKNGKIIGEGWHKRAGSDHAEVAAIKDALRNLKPQTSNLKHCTLYATLEPCSKPGRVGACTDAIIAAGLKRVVYGSVDPNPVNRGRAKRVLSRAGILCEQIDSEKVVRVCDYQIRGFRKHVTTGMPYVTVKIAMSLDGKICDDYGNARWISSAKSRKATGYMREWVDAIMVGAETVRKDNPSLLSHSKRNDDLIRVVVTRSGKLPKNAQIFTDGAPNETKVFRVARVISGAKVPADSKVLADSKVSTDAKGPIAAKDLKDVLRQLGKMGVMHVLCEGGLKLARSLADAGLVDEWISILAPVVIGSRHLKNALRLEQAGCIEQGGDIEGRFKALGRCRCH